MQILNSRRIKKRKQNWYKSRPKSSHDLNGIMSYLVLEAIGLKQKKIDLAVQYIDHNMLQSDYKNADDHNFILDMASRLGIITARSGNGICHHCI